MNIVIENENAQLVQYKLNFEQAKAHILQEVEKYKNLVVNEEFMQEAKQSRTDLNKMRKEIKEKLISLKKKSLEPYDAVKLQADELDAIIEEPLKVIDDKIKEHEQKLRDEKSAEIDKLYAELLEKYGLKIDFCRIANSQWLNQTYTMKKIKDEISCFFQRVKTDLEVIAEYPEEIRIPMELEYHRTYDMSKVMQMKLAYDKRQKELEEQKKAEAEKTDEPQAPTSDEKVNEPINPPTPQEKDDTAQVEAQENAPSEQKEIIKFWVEVTPAQKLLMREFITANNIKCGKIE